MCETVRRRCDKSRLREDLAVSATQSQGAARGCLPSVAMGPLLRSRRLPAVYGHQAEAATSDRGWVSGSIRMTAAVAGGRCDDLIKHTVGLRPIARDRGQRAIGIKPEALPHLKRSNPRLIHVVAGGHIRAGHEDHQAHHSDRQPRQHPHHQRRAAVTDHEAAWTARLNGGGTVVQPRVAGLVVTGAASSRARGRARWGRRFGRPRRCSSALLVVGAARVCRTEHAPRFVHGPHPAVGTLALGRCDIAALIGMIGPRRSDPRSPYRGGVGVRAYSQRRVMIGQLGHRWPPAGDATSARRALRRCSGLARDPCARLSTRPRQNPVR